MKQIMQKAGLSSTALKIVAITTMLVDHIAATQGISGSGYTIMRGIGRLAFPIFCFLIAEGAVHTRDIRKYALRLGIFALISEIPYDLAFKQTIWYPQRQNVFFTLFLGLVVVAFFQWAMEKPTRLAIWTAAATAAMWGAEWLHSDYGYAGVMLILLFYLLRPLPWWKYPVIAGVMAFSWHSGLQLYALLAFPLLWLYSGAKGRGLNKYVFYAFYPGHLLILWFLQIVQTS